MEIGSNLKNRTFVFYPEFSGMKEKMFFLFLFLFFGLLFMFLPEIFENKKICVVCDNFLYFYIIGLSNIIISISIFLYCKIYINSKKYFLTETYLSAENGFLNKKTSNLKLYQVNDLEIKQNFSQRIFGGGSIIIYSNDLTDPIIKITGLNIQHNKNVYKILNYFISLNDKNHK